MTKRNIGILILAVAVVVVGVILKIQPVSAQLASGSSCPYFSSTGFDVTGEQAIAAACNAMFQGQWNACIASGHGSNCTYSNQSLAFNCGMPASSGGTTGFCQGGNTANCIKAMTQAEIAAAVNAVCPTSAATSTPVAPGVLVTPPVLAVNGPGSSKVPPGGTFQFSTTVTGAPAGADNSVTWSLECPDYAHLIAAGTTSPCGMITATGLYTAPTTPTPLESASDFTIYARTNTAYSVQAVAGYVTTTTVAATGFLNVQFPANAVYLAGSSVPSPAQNMRYIQVSVNGIQPGAWISFGEIQAYDANGNQITIPAQNVSVSNNWTLQSWAIGPSGLVDNDINTGWNSGNTVAGCTDGTYCPHPNNALVTIDLGSVKQISRISVFHIGAPLGAMTLSGSTDGASYTQLGTFNDFNYGFRVFVDHQWIDFTLASGLFDTRTASTAYTVPSASGAIPLAPGILLPAGTGSATSTAPSGGGTGGTGPTGGGTTPSGGAGSPISSQINLDLAPALQGFSSILQGIAAQANSSGAQASSPVTVGGSTTSSTGGSCASVAASTVASSLQTLEGLSTVLAGQNVNPVVLSSIQALISSVAQVLSALSTCISAQQ